MLHALENIVGIFGCFLLIKKLTQELLQHLLKALNGRHEADSTK